MIGELWPRFIEFRTAGDPKLKLKPWRLSTLKEYDRFWECSFKYFWADKDENAIGENWALFIEAERKRSKKGIKLGFAHHAKYMGTFVSWLIKNGMIKPDAEGKVKKPVMFDPNWTGDESAAEKVKHVFTDEEARAMMKLTSGPFGLYIRMGLLMGMRSSEMTQLFTDRIDLNHKVIKLRAIDCKTGSKTGKGRTIAIHADMLEPLIEQMPMIGYGFLFPNKKDQFKPMSRLGFKAQWNALMKQIGVKHATPHCMRHTCATKLFSNPSLNPALIAKSMGFSVQMAMRVYVNFSDKDLSLVASNQSYGENYE
jgi:integrase